MLVDALWTFLPLGYLVTVAIEAPIVYYGLSPIHSREQRLFAGFWLTLCTYPIVVLVFPMLYDLRTERGMYLLVAETFAPLAECALFWAAFGNSPAATRRTWLRDMAVIVVANLASFGVGELWHALVNGY